MRRRACRKRGSGTTCPRSPSLLSSASGNPSLRRALAHGCKAARRPPLPPAAPRRAPPPPRSPRAPAPAAAAAAPRAASSSGATRARAVAPVAVAPVVHVLAFAAPLQVRVCALPPKFGRQQGEGEPLQAPLQAELAHRHCLDTSGRQPKSQPLCWSSGAAAVEAPEPPPPNRGRWTRYRRRGAASCSPAPSQLPPNALRRDRCPAPAWRQSYRRASARTS